MTVLSLRLSESLHKKLTEMAEAEGTSINQLINTAVAEKMAALLTERYLSERAGRGNRRTYLDILAKAGDEEPRETDAMPPRPPRASRK